jgi:hypothetical protein
MMTVAQVIEALKSGTPVRLIWSITADDNWFTSCAIHPEEVLLTLTEMLAMDHSEHKKVHARLVHGVLFLGKNDA